MSKTGTNKPTLAGLIAWLETQNLKTKYDYSCYEGECLIHQYLTAQGIRKSEFHNHYFEVQGWKDGSLPANGVSIALAHPHTFGAALDRAKAIAALP